MYITDSIKYIGVNDHSIDLFEGQYVVPNGMAYNSYVILDEMVAVMDTVDARFTHEWLDHLQAALDGRKPNFLIIQHMEPDHSANIVNFLKTYPETVVVASAKAFAMMKQFFGRDFTENGMVIKEGDTLCLGRRTLTFVAAPMVHWPEVMV
ncbi:MAG: MBL fold metallo-hydrolase, partial [Ruminococcaceae bacterium]|nr:MBL fold metallo-hydrolase [Oscillospiraceae bacterium]